MKNIKLLFGLAVAGAMMTSCVDDFDTNDFAVTRPGNLEQYEYLKDYAPLKSYLDRNAHGNLKVSAALTASEFNSKGNVFTLARANFDEVVAGNAMKMASCVDDKGNMNFGTVSKFVQTAEDGGLTIFGHTLAWHSQQANKWLTNLIADKPDPNAATSIQEVELGGTNFVGKTSFPFFVMGYEPTFTEEGLHSEYPGTWYQYFIADGIGIPADGEYTAIVKIKAGGSGTLALNMGWGWDEGQVANGSIAVTEEWTEARCKFTGIPGEKNVNLVLQPGTFEYPIDIAWCKVVQEQEVNDAIAYEERFTEKKKRCILIESSDLVEFAWDTQFWFKTNEPMHAGDSYSFSAEVYAWHDASIGTQLHNDPGAYVHYSAIGNVKFTDSWEKVTATGTIPSEGEGTYTVAFNLNDYAKANHYYLANLSFEVNGVEMLTNGDLSTDDNTSFYKKESRGNIVNIDIQDTYLLREEVVVPKIVEEYIEKRVLIVEAQDKKEYAWDTQFWIQTNEAFHTGDSYEFTAEVRADKEAAPGTQIHQGSAGNYMHWAAIGNPKFTTEWETVTATGTIPAEGNGGNFIAWNLNDFAEANKYMFGYISFKINGVEMLNNCDLKTDDNSSFWKKEDRGVPVQAPISNGYTISYEKKSTIPLTDEEKKDTLTFAFKKWINGMFDATEGKVKAWDLVNEAISGGGNVNGYYDLQHGSEENTTDFFWQDYLGSIDYVVIAEKTAREAYARQENNTGDLLLFINDYNLESDWDYNQKLKSLIYWVGEWEKAGAKIDGIGTQMHISLYENEKIQASKKAAITNMFKLMAATGKLVRVSELDMGLVDADGKTVTNAEMTFEREKAMADFYEWIIKEYFSIVPAAQQYGICQWCLTDANSKSGWRPDEPVGLWYQDYTRKPAYAGWAKGLGAQE